MAKIEDCPGFETFGSDVKAAREALNISRRALAEQVSIDPRYLANIELEQTVPSVPVVLQLIRICKLPVERYFNPSLVAENTEQRQRVNHKLQLCPEKYLPIIEATIDGATKPAQFRYMTLPLLKGVFKTNITMWSVSSVGFFVWSQLFSTVTADTQTITPYVYMYMQIFGGGNTVTERNAGLGAAIGVLLSVCVVIVFTICNRVIKDDDLEF